MPYGQTADTINPNTFPYLKKFTPNELEVLFKRIDHYRAVMVDMVGPSGVVMYIDAGTIANIAFHLSMVELDYIWPDVQEDRDGMFEGLTIWRLKKEHQPPEPVQDVDAKATAAREQIRKQLDPEVEAALIKQLTAEFIKDTTDPKDSQ